MIECTNYTWQFAGWDFDPRAQTNETCFRFEQQLTPAEWFYQTNRPSGSNIYWISIAAMWPPGPQPAQRLRLEDPATGGQLAGSG